MLDDSEETRSKDNGVKWVAKAFDNNGYLIKHDENGDPVKYDEHGHKV